MGLLSRLKDAFREAEAEWKKEKAEELVPANRASIAFKVAGVTKEGRQGRLKDRSLFEPIGTEKQLRLEPDDNNKHDPMAVKVVHYKAGVIGYVPKDTTARVRRFLESHENYAIKYKATEFEPDEDSSATLVSVTVRVFRVHPRGE